MKIIPILTLLIVLQLSFFIWDATADPQGQFLINTTGSNSSFVGSNVTNPLLLGNQTQYSVNLWDVVLNPSLLGGSNFIFLLLGLVGVAAAIAVGTYLIFKIDAIILFPVFTALLGFGTIPIVNLYNLIGREAPGIFGCQTVNVAAGIGMCFPSTILQVLSVSILGLWWLFACIDFWIKTQSS